MNEILIATIPSLVTGVTTWFLTRKKYAAEVGNSLIDGMDKSLDFYKKLSTDNKERLDDMIKRNNELEEEVAELKNQIYILMENICINLTCTFRQRNMDLFNNIKHDTDTEEKN